MASLRSPPRQLNIGTGNLLGTYVEREVLSRLSETEQHWLEMLSVFDALTPQAAESCSSVQPRFFRNVRTRRQSVTPTSASSTFVSTSAFGFRSAITISSNKPEYTSGKPECKTCLLHR